MGQFWERIAKTFLISLISSGVHFLFRGANISVTAEEVGSSWMGAGVGVTMDIASPLVLSPIPVNEVTLDGSISVGKLSRVFFMVSP